MQALLDDLGSAKSMYRDMYETSKNSSGSAMRENEIYMRSLEARIALTRVEFEKLAVSIGDAFLTDGMVTFLQLASGGLGTITSLVNGVGLLPIVLGTAGMATFALSNNFRTLSANVGSSIISLLGFRGAATATTTATNLLTATSRGLEVAWKGLGIAFKGFISSLGVGLPLVAIGFVIEKLMSKMGEARQKAEELESANKEMLNSYSQNATDIDELSKKYEELEKKMALSNVDSKTINEYRDIQNEIGTKLPSLVTGEDSYGNKLIGTSDALKVKIDLLKQQLEIDKQIADAEANKKRNEDIDTYNSDMNSAKDKMQGRLQVLANYDDNSLKWAKKLDVPKDVVIRLVNDEGEPLYKTADEVAKKLDEVKTKHLEAKNSGNDGLVEYYSKLLFMLEETYKAVLPHELEMNKSTANLKTQYIASLNAMISTNSSLQDSTKEMAQVFSSQLLSMSDSSNINDLKNGLETLFSYNGNDELSSKANEITANISKSFSDMANATEEDFGKTSTNVKAMLDGLPKLLKDVIKDEEDRKAVMDLLNKTYENAVVQHEKIAKAAKESGISFEQAAANAVEFGEGAEQSGNAVSELASKMSEFKDVTEQMAGVSQSGVDALNDLIWQYDTLSNQLAGYTEQQLQDIYVKENLTAEERSVKKVLDDRVAIMKELSGIYPDLLGKDGKAIALSDAKRKAIEQETKANEVLLKANKLSRDGKLSADQDAMLSSTRKTMRVIEDIKKEIAALNVLQKALQDTYNKAMESMKGGDPNSYTYGMKAARAGTLLGQAQFKTSNYTSELDALQNSLNTNIGKIDSFSTAIENSSKSTSSNTKATKENNAEKEKSIWITDKYKQKLEELNLAIEKQQKLQSKYPEWSKEYKKSLESQIKLEKEKLALQQKQAKAIQSQIASGKIQQTGSVSSPSTSNGKINGYSGKITSGYGERSDNHRGVDIAMPKGTRVDAPASGTVIKAGSATSETNGKKMDWTYGNLVVIEDKNGIRHLLAHLDSTLVKVGDQVEAGTQIGKSGSSGHSTGPHLHYEQNNSKGQTINPTATLNSIRSGNGTVTSSASSQQAVVWNYFKNKGLNDKAIAGLMGNIQQESGFNSSAVNKSSGASGIFQWLGGRKTGLQDYAKSVGKSWTDMQVQLDYAWKELQSTEKKSLASLQRNDLSSSQHASEFERLFERSGGSAVGKRQDYANQYYNQFAGTNGGAGIGIDTSQQAIDQAKSDLLSLQGDALNTQSIIDNLNEELVKSNLAYYDHLIDGVDRSIQMSNILASQQSEHSKAYRDELEKETKHLKYKQTLLHNEANFIRNQLKRKDLSPALKGELTTQLSELSLAWWDVAESIKDVNEKIQNSKVESYIAKYDELRQIQDKTISYEKAKLEELDTSSARYVKTLASINNAMREKQNSNRYELTQLTALINKNELQGDALEYAKNRIEELTLSIKELQIEIQDGDYDILINIKTQSDEKIGIMESAINQAEAIRKMFDEGSADYVKYTKVILAEYEKMAKQHLATRDALVAELQQRDVKAERIKEINKLMAEEHLAYVNATLSIKEYTKQVEEANKSQLESVADKAINAYKEYIQERRDEHIKTLDDEIKHENEKHEQIMKNLNDEMDLFRKNVEDKLRLIDRQEAQRSYDMEISDLEKERNNVQSQFDELALDNSHEGKAKRKKLKEQLDEIDKQIEEKRHSREVELRKESLNDALEAKEEEVNEKIELQDKEHENVINKINREKEYWEKHYKDLLNDERKFAEMREAILSGHFEKIDAEFQEYVQKMINTMPLLEDSLDGTMVAVGTSIRQNVIDNLNEALKLIDEFNDSQKASDNGSFNFNPYDGNQVQTSNGNLSQGDLQVLLGKFLFDNVAPNTSGSEKDNIRQMAEKLAEQGRKNGSTQFTKDDVNFNDSIKGLTQADMDALYEYFDSSKGMLGGNYDSFIEQFISSISGNKHESTNDGSLSKADMQVMLGKFIYEKLVPDTSLSANTKTALKAKADGVAKQGRNGGSKISENVTFDAIKSTYTSGQVNQMKSFFDSNLGMIDNAKTRELMQRKIASLDTGGFMNWNGTGIDGKGGKAIIAHPNEIMLNKVDTKGFFDSINVMDKVMSNLSPFLSKFAPAQKTSPVVSGDTYGDIKINFNIDKMNGDKNDLSRFNKMIDDDLLRRKGVRK
ncbi:peptidoglycan DD-metalloendopeptidase family protein [Lysinibacillus agricola]|uniref:Peptidoglycan DD-metalloendopeptidase family protein n=1 Tax=Lysinibacillus agricola TaxID=2590012 RepID=A0ABX7ALW4_9BACI|nr:MULTISPECIES: phage tail tip lysozyme [Lysinibacillus]KOS61418.1 hypothetical protein AN161_17630 [Lysinibacillus sp. FJAT-14222]QQP10903.1 peptidoglycan DD-metalloendopeptidase family protein [Lysinibacillus agricola]